MLAVWRMRQRDLPIGLPEQHESTHIIRSASVCEWVWIWDALDNVEAKV